MGKRNTSHVSERREVMQSSLRWEEPTGVNPGSHRKSVPALYRWREESLAPEEAPVAIGTRLSASSRDQHGNGFPPATAAERM
jgi:hypothetical protein